MSATDEPTPQQVIEVDLSRWHARGALVIDRVGAHGAFGGVRVVPDLRLDELKAGARAMGRKFAFINVPIGGAKSAIEIAIDLPAAERTRLIEAFGRELAPLIQSRTYLPACDMGTDQSDLGTLLSAAGVPLTPDQIDSSRATALTIVESVRHVTATIGVPMAEARIALEGLGKVGGQVATMLSAARCDASARAARDALQSTGRALRRSWGATDHTSRAVRVRL
jgi:glutamate dehydrogenase (NAD(P)+)